MKVEIRNNQVKLDGYVNVVQRDSRVLPSARGKFIEQIEPRTFQKALDKTNNVDLLFNHREDRKLGSTSEGNLTLYEDNIGLRAICTVTDQEVVDKAKNNELRGWSFAMAVNEDRWQENGEISRRFVSDIDLFEVSILSVTPAYIATSIEARDGEEVMIEQRAMIDDPDNDGDTNKDNDNDGDGQMDISCFQAMIDSCQSCIKDCQDCIDFCNQLLKSTTDPALIAYCQACILQCQCCIQCCTSCIGCCELCLKSYQVTGTAPTIDFSVFEQQIAKLKGGMM
jgi:HK97 family phage prohead protease